MSNQSSDDFRFGTDQEVPDEALQDAPEDNRIAKLSRRITVLAIIIPCLIGIALFFLYLDLKGRVVQNQASGYQSVSELSQAFEGQLQDVAAKLSQLESGISEKAAATDKQITELKTEVGKLEGSLKTANSLLKKIDAAKAEKADQEKLGNQVTALSTQVGTLSEALEKKIGTLSTEFDTASSDVAKFRQDIGEFKTLVDSKIDRRTLLLELDKQQQKLTLLSGDLEKNLISIRAELRRIDSELQQARQSLRRSSAPTSPPATTRPGSSGTGKIVEQNLD